MPSLLSNEYTILGVGKEEREKAQGPTVVSHTDPNEGTHSGFQFPLVG